MAPKLMPGKPLPPEEIVGLRVERLYQLSYLHHHVQKSKLVYFPDELKLDAIVERCKEYCTANNYRFVWVESAITTIE